jgi:hypothetical protein
MYARYLLTQSETQHDVFNQAMPLVATVVIVKQTWSKLIANVGGTSRDSRN